MATLQPDASDSAVIHQISLTTYQTILTTQQQHANDLAEKYRNFLWQDPKVEKSFMQGFIAELNKEFNPVLCRQKIDQYLRKLFLPNFFQTPEYEQLNQNISALLQSLSTPTLSASHAQNQSRIASVSEVDHQRSGQETFNQSQSGLPSKDQDSKIEPTSGIAILLLDVENLKLDQVAENFLNKICNYPIQIKIAFANWRAIGKKDIEFHRRGYQMIHVPIGENSADMKMTAIGSSIFLRYPNVREILICSSDSDLTHLCHTLSTHGLTVYSVKKQGEGLRVANLITKVVKHYDPRLEIELPSIPAVIHCLKTVIKEEQARTKQTWIALAKASILFHEKMGVRIGQIVSYYSPAQPVKEFLMEYPGDFVVHKPAGQSALYVTTFELDVAKDDDVALPSSLPLAIEKPDSEKPNKEFDKAALLFPSSDAQPIRSRQELETILIALTTQLLNSKSSHAIRVSTVASEFNKLYGRPITQVMKAFGIKGNLPSFLSTVDELRISQEGKDHYISRTPRY